MTRKILFILLALVVLLSACARKVETTSITTTTTSTTVSSTNLSGTTTTLSGATTTTSTVSTTTTTIVVSGNTYYVSTTGSNEAGDGSESNPWATPGYGVSQLQAGDLLIIKGGLYIITEYNEDRLIPQNSGVAGSPIIIRGELTNRPTLAARNTAASYSDAGLGQIVDLNNKNYLTIENLEFTHDPTATGTVDVRVRDCISGNGNNIILKDLYIHHIDQFGVNIQDINGLTIQNSTIEYCGFGAVGAPDMGAGGGWQNILIDSCDMSYNGHYYRGGNDARVIYDRPDGIGLEEGPGPIEVKNSLFEHNYGDGIDIKLDRAYVHENTVRNNTANGIKIWGQSSTVENCVVYGTGDGAFNGWDAMVVAVEQANTTISFINNTVHDIGTRSAYAMIVQYDEPYRSTPIRLIMKNNIFSDSNGEIWLAGTVSPEFHSNLFNRYSSSNQVTIGGVGHTISQLNALANCTENISADPQFVNPVWGGAEGDYHLQSSSPAIDTGTSEVSLTTDLDGNSRPIGNGFDIGAYEQ